MGIDWWFGSMPWVVGFVWVAHALLSWYRPRRMNPAGWLLLAGLPVAAVVLLFVSTQMPDDGLRGVASMSSPSFGVLALGGELVLIWCVVLLLECLLHPTRRARAAGARRVAP